MLVICVVCVSTMTPSSETCQADGELWGVVVVRRTAAVALYNLPSDSSNFTHLLFLTKGFCFFFKESLRSSRERKFIVETRLGF